MSKLVTIHSCASCPHYTPQCKGCAKGCFMWEDLQIPDDCPLDDIEEPVLTHEVIVNIRGEVDIKPLELFDHVHLSVTPVAKLGRFPDTDRSRCYDLYLCDVKHKHGDEYQIVCIGKTN